MDAKQSPLRTAWTHSQWHSNTKRTLFILPFLFSLLKFGILKSGCGHAAPNSFVSLVPIQVLLGLGAAHLYSFTGASAYGIPRYSYTVLPFGSVSSLPTMVPDVVFTSGALSLAWIWRERASEFKQSYLIAFSFLRSVFFLSFSEIDCELHFEFQICNHFHLEHNVPCLPPNPPSPPGPSKKMHTDKFPEFQSGYRGCEKIAEHSYLMRWKEANFLWRSETLWLNTPWNTCTFTKRRI